MSKYTLPAPMTSPGLSTIAPAVCALCREVSDPSRDGDPPLGWCADQVETRDGTCTRWLCAACTRRHVRSIEAKLDSAWW